MGELYDLFYRIGGGDLLVGDDTGVQTDSAVGEQVSAVKDIGVFCTVVAVGGLVDLADLLDAELPQGIGQGAVARRHDVIAVGGFGDAGAPRGPYTGTHHGDKNRTRRQDGMASRRETDAFCTSNTGIV